MDDAELVRQACEGDREAFAAIYDTYAARLHNFLCSVLRDRDEAADVLHDTFLVAGSRLHQLRDPTKLRPWLYAIARHEALRRIKQRARQEPLPEAEVTDTGPLPEDVARHGELVELVQSAADGLSPRDRVVLDLHLRQGLEGPELGEAMGVTANHAYVLLSRLRDQVERSLGALLVTRLGRDDCEILAAVLDGWDGRFTPLVRKRVARHVDGCEQCSDVRSRAVSPLALLAAVPPIALPAELRERVLGDVELVSHRGRPWPGGRQGFPPPMVASRRRRPLLGAAAAVVVLLIAIVASAGRAPAPVVETEGITVEEPVTTVPTTGEAATTTITTIAQPATTTAETATEPPGPAGAPAPARTAPAGRPSTATPENEPQPAGPDGGRAPTEPPPPFEPPRTPDTTEPLRRTTTTTTEPARRTTTTMEPARRTTTTTPPRELGSANPDLRAP